MSNDRHRPIRSPKRLAGHDWIVIESGSVVAMAGEVSFIYEAKTTDCG